MLRLVHLCLVLWLVTTTYGDSDCECVECIWCRIVGNRNPKDSALQAAAAYLVSRSELGCLDGTYTNSTTCGANGACITQWGKSIVKAEHGETMVMEFLDRICMDITGVEDIYRDGCRKVTNSAWPVDQRMRSDQVLGPMFPTLTFHPLHIQGCACHECQACNSLSREENCPPTGHCRPKLT